MSRSCIVASLLSLFVTSNPVFAQPATPGGKKPETSKVADFDATKLTKIAILVVGGAETRGGVLTENQRIVEDAFLECLLAKGHTVVARSDMESLLREKQFQQSGLTEDNAASVGKFLNVPAVLVLRLTEVSADLARQSLIGKVSLGARLIGVENGAILWNGKHSETLSVISRGACSGLVLLTAAMLAETFPDKKKDLDIAYAKEFGPKSVNKLAIITLDGKPLAAPKGPNAARPQSDQQRLVEDAFIQVLLQKGYSLVSRSDLQSIVKEQQFQRSGLSEDNAVAVGKLLNVPAVLVVRITDYATEPVQNPMAKNKNASLTRTAMAARLIDVSNGEILWTHGEWSSRETTAKSDASDLLDTVAKDVVNFFPPAAETNKTLLAQADKLEKLGQISSAIISYQAALKRDLSVAEKKKVEQHLKTLTSKKAGLSP
jgi:hypothetical protein